MNRYFFGMDLIRFVAALMVAVFHLTWGTNAIPATEPFGWAGVQVFFVISGFVIANSASQASVGAFVESRILRLYPAAWICVVISVLVILGFGNSHHEIGVTAKASPQTLFFGLLLMSPGPPFLASAYWTLPVEIAFYAVVAILIATAGFKKAQWLAIGMTAWSAPYLLALGAVSFGLIDAPWLDLGYGWLNCTLLRHGPYFALGLFLWLHLQGHLGPAARCAVIAALGLAVIEIGCRAVELAPFFHGLVPFERLWSEAVGVWLASCIALYGAAAYADRFPSSLRLRTMTRTLGLMTYPFYLLHEAVGGNVMAQALRRGLDAPAALAIALTVVGITSYAVVGWEARVKMWLRSLLRALMQIAAAMTRKRAGLALSND